MTALMEVILLFKNKTPLSIHRHSKYQRLSNGDQNELQLQVVNHCNFKLSLDLIDELPVQFQFRNFKISIQLQSAEEKKLAYTVRPLTRGEYHFGKINAFLKSPLNLIERHFTVEEPFLMKCYPSFIKLRQFELMAISNRLSDTGIKKIRRIGHSSEFEQIKEYVIGDDIRTINWKATARRDQLMINHYRDERAQQVYCLVDMGRIMKMPFDGMTLLDHSVNASLDKRRPTRTDRLFEKSFLYGECRQKRKSIVAFAGSLVQCHDRFFRKQLRCIVIDHSHQDHAAQFVVALHQF